MWRTASGILSFVSFHGYRLTCAFGARCTVSIATAYGCPGTSSGRTSIGVWQSRTNSRVTVYTKSARARYMLVRRGRASPGGSHWATPAGSAAGHCLLFHKGGPMALALELANRITSQRFV